MRDDDERETEVDSDEEAVLVAAYKNNIWLVITALAILLKNISVDVSEFFDTLSAGSLQRFAWERDRQVFFETAGQQFEELPQVLPEQDCE